MLAGAVVGAELLVHRQLVYPLLIALVVTASVAATAAILGRSNPGWVALKS
jgi:cell division protein FtsL